MTTCFIFAVITEGSLNDKLTHSNNMWDPYESTNQLGLLLFYFQNLICILNSLSKISHKECLKFSVLVDI